MLALLLGLTRVLSFVHKNAELFTLTYGALVRQARAVETTLLCLSLPSLLAL